MGKKSLHVKTLAASIGLALASAVLPLPASAAGSSQKAASAEQATARHAYIVRFEENGLLHYRGEIAGLAATAPGSNGGRKLDVRSSAAIAYQAHLAGQREAHLSAIRQALGRAAAPTHSYAITMNGVALELTPKEATRVAGLPGVRSVHRARDRQLDTYRGPEFIGAPTLWDGTNVPGGTGTRGFGVVVGVIDTGANTGHPSFADDATCGFSGSNHKQISAVDCSSTDGGGTCNGPNPEANNANGHGVHTASTAAGNVVTATAVPPPTLPPDVTFMSGVAPCASLRTYKVCETNTCGDTAIFAGIENAIADGVDVINYSISGGQSPWDTGESDRQFLDALQADIFVAASAGNTRATTPDPVGQVNHLGPWVTTVAASTHNRNVAADGELSVTGPGTPPAQLQHITLTPGSGPDPGTSTSGLEIRQYAGNVSGCTATGAFPANYFDGAIALIERGGCNFSEKIQNADDAGAAVAIIYNNTTGGISMNVGATTLPAYSILQSEGQAIVAFINSAGSDPDRIFQDGFDGPIPPEPVVSDFTAGVLRGDVLGGFSLRGPSQLVTVTKPDITGPGVNIYAAVDDATTGGYGFLSGTSMSSPHVAGAGALLRAAQPGWTPAEVKSAMMLTAVTAGFKEDVTTPWDADDVGSGRIDLTKAAKAGFVLNETYANFLAADPAASGDPKTLNIASMRNMSCVDSCNWTRTLRGTLSQPSNWTVSFNAPSGVTLSADTTSFSLDGSGTDTQAITITATPTTELTNVTFAEVVFTEANGLAPDAHMYVAIKGSGSGNTDIVDSGEIDLDIPATFDGLYLNWVTGTSADPNVNFYDVDVTDPANGLHFYWPNNASGEGAVGSGGTYDVLASGATVGPGSTFISAGGSADTSNWQSGVDGYLGFRFVCAVPGGFCYGYAHLTTTAPQGFPATVVRYWYNSAGDPITIP